jgi:hypothetical protein
MSKYNHDRRFIFRENIFSVATIITGIIVIVSQHLGWIKDQSIVNSFMIALLCLIATSEIFQRIDKLSKIESGITSLLRARDCEFTVDIDEAWIYAARLVKNVRKDGHIYDTSSIKNNEKYEDAIEDSYKAGVHITRIVCTDDFQTPLEKFIRSPNAYRSKNDRGDLIIKHLPFKIPLDMLITEQSNEIQAIFGLRRSEVDGTFYSSSLKVYNKEFANVILSMFLHVLVPETDKHQNKIKNVTESQCKICNEIKESAKKRGVH